MNYLIWLELEIWAEKENRAAEFGKRTDIE